MHKNAKKTVLMMIGLVVMIVQLSFVLINHKEKNVKATATTAAISSSNGYAYLYDSLALSATGLSRKAFDYALAGYNRLKNTGKLGNTDVLSIIDFTQPSSAKRLVVINLKTAEILFNTYVSHGRGSGREMAMAFSNQAESYKSSLGFYVTSSTYEGKHGYSLRLNGEERGINDNALSRGIVMHSAEYVDENVVRSQGFCGRSQGCPAVPEKLHKAIIQKIKDGSCLFIYSTDKYYAEHSSFMKAQAV